MYEEYDFLTIEQNDLDKLNALITQQDAETENKTFDNADALGYDTGVTDIDIIKLREIKGLITKKDIADIFEVGEKTAQNILIHMMSCGYAEKLGRTYYTTREHTAKYIMDWMGKEVVLQG